jgi:hypothetical protein
MSSLPSEQVNQQELEKCALEASYVTKQAVRQLENLVTEIAVSWHADTDEAWSKGRIAILCVMDGVRQVHEKVTAWAKALVACKPQMATTNEQFSLVVRWAECIAAGWDVVKGWALIHKVILHTYKGAVCKDTAHLAYNFLRQADIGAQMMHTKYSDIQGQILHIMSSKVVRGIFTEYVGSQIQQKRQQITQSV